MCRDSASYHSKTIKNIFIQRRIFSWFNFDEQSSIVPLIYKQE